MTAIKNIVFDLGGVLTRLNLQGSVEAFRRLGFSDIDQYLNLYTQRDFFGDVEAGRISDQEFCRQLSQHVGHELSWQQCQQGWLGFMESVTYPNLQELLKLRGQGYRLALLSNINPFVAAWFRSEAFDGHGHSLDHYIGREHQYLSYEQHCMKPGLEIFNKLLAAEGFVAGETLFVDDGQANVDAARRLGMATLKPQNGELWGEKLQRLLGN